MSRTYSNRKEPPQKSRRTPTIHATEFECQTPLRFFEHCLACPQFDKPCRDLTLGKEILEGKKKLVFAEGVGAGQIHANDFGCVTPLHYFDKTRQTCAHRGRCREEGLLLTLLSGRKTLTYAHRPVIELPLGDESRIPSQQADQKNLTALEKTTA